MLRSTLNGFSVSRFYMLFPVSELITCKIKVSPNSKNFPKIFCFFSYFWLLYFSDIPDLKFDPGFKFQDFPNFIACTRSAAASSRESRGYLVDTWNALRGPLSPVSSAVRWSSESSSRTADRKRTPATDPDWCGLSHRQLYTPQQPCSKYVSKSIY